MTDTTTGDATADTAGKPIAQDFSVDELKTVLEDLGLKPGQIRGRLEASRKWEDRAREKEPFIDELKAKAKRLDELESEGRSEIEKAQARADAAEKELTSTRIDALRNSVALDKKLTPSQAKRLVGTTREELEADADELLIDLKNTQPPTTPTTEGQGKQGAPVGQTEQIKSRDQLKSMTSQQIDEAHKEGKLDGLLGVK